jgi:hypothetical protein
MFTNDANFYTIKQIDKFLDRNVIMFEWGVTSQENTRNILIDRLKTRLAIANGMGHSIKGEKRAKVLMDAGFANYKKVIDLTIGDGWSRTVQNPPQEIEVSFRKFAGDILDKVGGIKEAKFVFCDESIEFKFHTEDDLDYSFEYFYDTTEEMIASVGIPTKSTWSDGQKKRAYIAASLKPFDLDSALKIVENCKSELAARIALGLIG